MKKHFLFYITLLFGINSYCQNLEIPPFGSDSTFEIISWNIEWFPKNGQNTLDYVNEIIVDLDADLYALQEIDDKFYFDQLLEGLEGWNGYYVNSEYSNLAYVYKMDIIDVIDLYEIYTTQPYWRPFPRAPMVMKFKYLNQDYVVINNHFKCCGDGIMDNNDPWDEETRRNDASILLEEYIRTELPNDRVILLGDLNDLLSDPPAHNVFNVFFENEENYKFVDLDIAEGSSYNWSYPSWPSHLDHILITSELFEDFSKLGSEIQTLRLDDFFDGGFSEYDEHVSDHRPVALKLKTNPILGEVEPIFTKSQLTNFPNPFLNETTITFDAVSKNSIVEIFDLIGNEVDSWTLRNKQSAIKWDASGKPGGIYCVRLKSGNEIIAIRKIILLN